MITDPHFDAVLDQIAGNVGLNVRKTDGKIGFERQDLIDLGAGKSADARLFTAHARRPHREA